jgi:glycosyltransferase involved in cell wall biosynthesis
MRFIGSSNRAAAFGPRKVFILDSHPVQYKAPVYRELNRLAPGSFEVLYATDASVRGGNVDRGFGTEVAWDIPLLQGYPYRILGNERGVPLTTPGSLTGKGIFSLLRRERPAAVLLTGFYFRYDQVAYLSALALRIPILVRHETQDEMFAGSRTRLKSWLRSAAYRVLYAPVSHAFAIGELNRTHMVRYGLAPERITVAHYSVPNPIEPLSDIERLKMRMQCRADHGMGSDRIVVGFSGKLIPKKNPDLLLRSLEHIKPDLRRRLHLLFIGSGELRPELERLARQAEGKWGVASTFAGFVNQSRLPPYYLAMDIFVLPSRRMGEAWGLVVNEALQAGCSVVVSDAVGCRDEFKNLPRVRVIPVEGDEALARAIEDLSPLPREFRWADTHMSTYSTRAAAERITIGLKTYLPMS